MFINSHNNLFIKTIMADQYAPSYMQGKPMTQQDALASKAGDLVNDRLQLQNTRKSFNQNGQYSVSNLMYPIDLISTNSNEKHPSVGGSEYGNNYVVFYINVNESSKLLKDQNPYTGNSVVGSVESDKTTLAGQKVTQRQADVGVGAQPLAAGGVASLATGRGDALQSGAGLAALSVAGTQIIGTQAPGFSRQKKRLAAAIALNTPNQHTARYSTNWEDASTSAFQLAMRGGETFVRAIVEGAKTRNISDETSDNALAMGAAFSLNKIPGADAVSNITGLAVNPKREQIFKGVDFRTWTFEYQFFPRSRQEMENVQNIIYTLKLHMHPEYKDANNFLYIYPSEFDIVHYNGTTENLNLPRHTSCVLTELLINYTPQAQFNSFEYGAPTQINVTMTFKELVQMSKERIQEGY
jgi:hypothetical protein